MTQTVLKNQIQDLAERLDELNRVTRLCAMGTPFEETGGKAHHILLPTVSERDYPPLADHFPPQTCAFQSLNLGEPFELDYTDTADEESIVQSHITCLNSLEHMPTALLQPPQPSHLPPPLSTIPPICDAHILQSEELLKLQERQFNLQDHLMDLMHRVQDRERPSKPTRVEEAGPPTREHDIDEHVKVLKTVPPARPQLKSANRKSPVSQKITKHPTSLSKNNSAVQTPGSKRKQAWSPGAQCGLQKPPQSVKETIPSTKTATEGELNDASADDIPTDVKPSPTPSPQFFQEVIGDKSDLQEIKQELALLRDIFGKELEDVRNFLQENREEIERSRRTTQELKFTKEGKENFQPENQQTHQQLNLSDGSHLPTEDVVTNLQAPRFHQISAPPPDNSTLLVAQKALREVEQRRNNLETNISAFERSRKCQGFFDILDMLGKDEDAVERARIKAMVDDAISNTHITPLVSRNTTATSAVRRPVNDAPRRGRGASSGVSGRVRDPAKHVSTSPIRPTKAPTLASIISLSPPQKPPLQLPSSTRPMLSELKATASAAGRFKEASAPPPPSGVFHVPRQPSRSVQDTVPITRKAVRFDDGVPSNSELSEYIQEPRPRSPAKRRAIQPLGMRQYSMCPLEQAKPPAKPAQNVGHQDQIGTGLMFNHLPGVDAPKTLQPPVREVPLVDSILHRQMEEEVVSRLLRQLALAFSQPQAQAPTPLVSTTRAPNLRDLVETALLERVARGDLLTPQPPPPKATAVPCSPEPTAGPLPTLLESSRREAATEEVGEISSKAPSSTSTAPPHVSVCDRAASARPLSSPSTLSSLPRRQQSQHSRAVSAQSFLRRVEERASEHSPASTMLDENEDRTLDEQPPLSLSGTTSPLASLVRPQPSMRSEAVSAHEPALPPSPALISYPRGPPRTPPPATTPPPPSTSTAAVGEVAPVSPPIHDLSKSQSPDKVSSDVRPSSYTSTLSKGPSSEWSLTAPHSFSDGVWLEERSEGEAAQYSLCPSIAAKLGPLPPTTSEELSSTDSGTKECGADSSNASTTSNSKLSCGELTAEKLCKGNSSVWVAPWRNPLLHLMALNAAGSSSHLPWNRFVEVQRTAAAVRSHQQQQLHRPEPTAGEGDGMETSPTGMTSDLRWVKETLAELKMGSPCQPRRRSDPETSDVLSAGEIKSDFVESPNRVLHSNMREPPLSQAKGDIKELASVSRSPELVRQGVYEVKGSGGLIVHPIAPPSKYASDTSTDSSNNQQVTYDEDFEPQENCNCATDTSSSEGTKRSLLLAVREFSDDENDEDAGDLYGETDGEERQMSEDVVSSSTKEEEEYKVPCALGVGGGVSPTATSATTTQWVSVSREALPGQGSPDADQQQQQQQALLLSTARDSFPDIEEEAASTSSPSPPLLQLISTPRLLSHRQGEPEQSPLLLSSSAAAARAADRSGSGGSEEDAGRPLGEQSEPPDEGTRQLDAECLHMSTPPESPLESTDLPSTQELLDNALRQTISLGSSFGNVEEEEEAAAVGEEVTDT